MPGSSTPSWFLICTTAIASLSVILFCALFSACRIRSGELIRQCWKHVQKTIKAEESQHILFKSVQMIVCACARALAVTLSLYPYLSLSPYLSLCPSPHHPLPQPCIALHDLHKLSPKTLLAISWLLHTSSLLAAQRLSIPTLKLNIYTKLQDLHGK